MTTTATKTTIIITIALATFNSVESKRNCRDFFYISPNSHLSNDPSIWLMIHIEFVHSSSFEIPHSNFKKIWKHWISKFSIFFNIKFSSLQSNICRKY